MTSARVATVQHRRLPLHCAIEKGASEGVVSALLAAFPEAIEEKDDVRVLIVLAMCGGGEEVCGWVDGACVSCDERS